MDGGFDRKISRANHDFIAVVAVDKRQEIAEEVASLGGGFVHLPSSGEEFFSHEGPFWNINAGQESG
jgi:hypothetical protein